MRKRRVSFNNDPALVQPLGDIRMVQPGMQLVLADGDLAPAAALDILLQLFEVVDAVVRDADGLGLARFLGFH